MKRTKCTKCSKKVKNLIEVENDEVNEEYEYYCRSCFNKLKTKLNNDLEFTRGLFNIKK